MDDTKVTPDLEAKEVTPAAEAKAEPAAETVPLAVFLDLKEDMKELKKQISDSKGSTQTKVTVEGFAELTNKYPDVSPEFIQDMLGSATKEATKIIEAKYTPIIEKAEAEKKQEVFDKAFDSLFNKVMTDNPSLPRNIDKETIKALALTPNFKDTPLQDILLRMYPVSEQGKPSSENDMRTGADRVEDIVSFDKITDDQKNAIMDDPKARAKYFNWLDTQPGR